VHLGEAHKFTGKERDAESGLDNFGARYNASTLGRFMTPDPIGIMKQKFVDPQQWNMYAYVRSNPLRFVDPTGAALELIGSDIDRKKIIDSLKKAFGDKAGRYLYDNVDKATGKHYVGVYTNGQDGKSVAFEKTNAAASKLGAIIDDKRVATVELVKPGIFSPVGSDNAKTDARTTGAAVNLNSGTLRALPPTLLSSGKSEVPNLGDVVSHELGHVYSRWFGGGADTNGYAVRMENETRRLNGESIRLGHDSPNEDQSHPGMDD
jgi:RHS repeat-associated protein